MSFTAKIISNTQSKVDANTKKLVIEIEIKMDPEPEQLKLELLEPKAAKILIDHYGICDIIEDYLHDNNGYIKQTTNKIVQLLKDHSNYDHIQSLSNRGFSKMLSNNLLPILDKMGISVERLGKDRSVNEYRWIIMFKDANKISL